LTPRLCGVEHAAKIGVDDVEIEQQLRRVSDSSG